MAISAVLPRDCTTEQAREMIGKQISALNRAINEGAQQLAARDRIIERLTAEKANLEAKLDALRALRADDKLAGAGTVAAARLTDELERWRGVAASTLSALEHALAQVPACFTAPSLDQARHIPLTLDGDTVTAVKSPQPTLQPAPPSDESNHVLICPTLEEQQRPFPPATPPADVDRCLGPLDDMLAILDGATPPAGGEPSNLDEAPPAGGSGPGGCGVPWCPNAKSAKGYCATHYGHLSEYGDPLLTKRFKKGLNDGKPLLCREVGLGQYEPVAG